LSPTFIPPLQLDKIAHGSEQRVAESLAGLSPEWVVLHSYPWLRPNRDLRDAPLREGEADFLLLHPRWGLLVVEVKGGELELRNRIWRRGGEEIKDPFRQAARNRHALLDAVEERTKRAVQRGALTHGDVVILPHHTGRGDLPHDADPRTILFASDLNHVEERLVGASKAYGERPKLDPARFQQLISALLPSYRAVRCTSADIAVEASRFVELTEAQHAVLTGLLANPRVLIEGVAGSGKTLLALEFAIRLAEQGLRTQLLCFNKHLATWLSERLRSEPRVQGAPGVVHASHFHKFALQAAKTAEVEFEIKVQDDDHFWREEAAMILSQAIGVLEDTPADLRVDALVVDEGQDFEQDWWVPIDELVGGSSGRLYVFLDQHQRLRDGVGTPRTTFAARMQLDVNCRNTRSVALTAASLQGIPSRVLERAPEGERPTVHRASSPEAMQGIVNATVSELLRDGIRADQVAIIGPASWRRGSLRRAEKVAATAIVDDPAEWRKGGGLLVTTARAFKGLEADVVVLYDVAGFGSLFTLRDVYVGMTRAKHRLVVCAAPGEARAAIEGAIAEGHGP
jgi:hypothetical protein